VDLGKHVIATRTKAFLQAQRYFKNRYRTIDIDNHVELAQTIEAESGLITGYPLPAHYNAETNRAMYIALLSGVQLKDVGGLTGSGDAAAAFHPIRRPGNAGEPS
jgi:hypothetical protein